MIGETLIIDGVPHELIGILPQGFAFLAVNQDIFVPLPERTSTDRDSRNVTAIARMSPGATMAQVRTEMVALFDELATQHQSLAEWTIDSYACDTTCLHRRPGC